MAKSLFKTLGIVCLLLCTFSCTSSKKKSESKPQQANILLIVADDMGFSDIAPFGGEVSTPALSNLAKEGVMLTNFHVLPTCSPTRSVLMSGTDNHLAGLGSMEEMKTARQKGKPGYEGYLNNRVAHLPQVLKDAGYKTYMSGKWHLGLQKENWPSKKGFDETFALLQGGGSHYADERPLSPPEAMQYTRNGEYVDSLPDDFYSSKYYTDNILELLERDKNSEKPFFAYVAYTAPHDPLHAPKEYIYKYKGKYDEGFEVLREKRFESLKQLGIISTSATLPPWPLKKWEQLSGDEQKRSARDMEVYAAMVDYMDGQIFRILDWLEKNNKMDNTMIVFFSDNGANGAPNTIYPEQTEEFLNSFDNSIENIGLPNSFQVMGPGWASASMSPFRLFKGLTTEGGIISPCIIKLPASMKSSDKTIKAFAHVSDVMPTFLDIAGADHPSKFNKSIPGMIGTSMLSLLDGEKEAIHINDGIGYELHGMRAYIKDEWKIVSLPKPFGTGDWELHNLAQDPSEVNDLSAEFPDKRNELIAAWEAYSKDVGVVFDPVKMSSQGGGK